MKRVYTISEEGELPGHLPPVWTAHNTLDHNKTRTDRMWVMWANPWHVYLLTYMRWHGHLLLGSTVQWRWWWWWWRVVVGRFELWVRQSCPHPYSDATDALVLPCEPGELQPVLKSLVYSTSVDNLTPYTMYEFQLSVVNEAGSLQQPLTTYVTTLPAGNVSIIDSSSSLPSLTGCTWSWILVL